MLLKTILLHHGFEQHTVFAQFEELVWTGRPGGKVRRGKAKKNEKFKSPLWTLRVSGCLPACRTRVEDKREIGRNRVEKNTKSKNGMALFFPSRTSLTIVLSRYIHLCWKCIPSLSEIYALSFKGYSCIQSGGARRRSSDCGPQTRVTAYDWRSVARSPK